MYHPLPFSRLAPPLAGEHFILLETSRCDPENRTSYCFTKPVEILHAVSPGEVPALLDRIERFVGEGYYAAGYLAYECGYQYEEIGALAPSGDPIAFFGVYRRPIIFDHGDNRLDGNPAPGEARDLQNVKDDIENLTLDIDARGYADGISSIKHHLHEGDTYQINYTTRYTFGYHGDPVALYARLRRNQPVPYGALIRAGNLTIASFSPELFFRIRNGVITTRPMKGTAGRGLTADEDRRIQQQLRTDSKSRAENLMIVDLLRNDLGRICLPGSVSVKSLFDVEQYRTLHQMTSTIEGRLVDGVRPSDLMRVLFPCGSVTGAPKIRSMQIIHGIERRRRGVYTGAIGFFAPGGDATFSVAIRTVELQGTRGSMGVGSGIVDDSDAAHEFAECKLKAAFLTGRPRAFGLIETMLWDGGYPFLDMHLLRLCASAGYFEFPLAPDDLRSQLITLAEKFVHGTPHRVRLTIDAEGRASFSFTPLRDDPLPGNGRIVLSPHHTHSTDVFLHHKTTCRTLYDEEFARARRSGFAEVIFRNEHGEVTEGAISNIFIERQGRLFTPPVSAGPLNGIYRRHLLTHRPDISERTLLPQDILTADAVYCCNAVRGMWKVVPAFSLDGEQK